MADQKEQQQAGSGPDQNPRNVYAADASDDDDEEYDPIHDSAAQLQEEVSLIARLSPKPTQQQPRLHGHTVRRDRHRRWRGDAQPLARRQHSAQNRAFVFWAFRIESSRAAQS